MKRIYYILLLVVFSSCAKELSKDQKNIASGPLAIDYKKELKSYFASNFSQLDSAFAGKSFPLDSVYARLDNKIIWINDSIRLNKDAQRLVDSLLIANEYGLQSAYYQTNTIQKLKQELYKVEALKDKYRVASQLELLLSNAYLLYGKHLNHGVLENLDSITVLAKKTSKIDFKNLLAKTNDSINLIDALFALQPKHETYAKVRSKLVDYMKNGSLSTDNINVINFRKDSIKAKKLAQKALILHKYLDSVSTDSVFTVALQKFQKEHGLKPDGVIGNNTAKALSKSPYRYYQTLVANLERWRWKEAFPEDYLLANIAGFNVKMYVDNKVKHQYRTVVGKYKSQTPEIRDSILSVIAYPYWYVPKKITLKEVLVKAQNDSTYFKRNNFEIITYQRQPVDYTILNWDEINSGKFNYLVRQGGGWSNSLGLVKFIFPNAKAIYLHDSPSKSLYGRDKRAYSHGCVRVQHALKLADNILTYDDNKMSIDSVQKYIRKKKQKAIKLKKRLPVHLYYFTADVDVNGNVIIYDDVYNKDKIVLEKMRRFNKKYLATN